MAIQKGPSRDMDSNLTRVQMGEDEKRKNSKNEKTKVVVWDAIRTAIEPEKKIRTAEIEIYRLVRLNGPPGIRKILKI